jgi:long-chain fatty acid transport protein
MKRTTFKRIGQGIALSLLTSTLLHATNGDHLIAVGAKARAMGGAGIAVSHCAESTLHNPALITCTENTSISFGGTIFMPDISATMGRADTHESAADMNVIPEVSISHRLNDNWYLGIGMWGTGGLGVDYRDEPTVKESNYKDGTGQMVTALQTMQFGVPLAYTSRGFSMGFTPIVQYSSLDINYDTTGLQGGKKSGTGVAQDLAYGYTFGLDYKIRKFTVGAVYKSKITFDVKDVLNNAIQSFGVTSYDQKEMATPAEFGLGLSYNFKQHTIAFDYKTIKWSDAEGYKDFEWEDQTVMALGYEYTRNKWAARAGYQYAKSAVQDQGNGKFINIGTPTQHDTTKNSAGLSETLVNTFNLLGFPGTQETHVTFGGSYVVNETISLDSALVLGLESKQKYKNFANQDIESKHSEKSLSIQLNYAF